MRKFYVALIVVALIAFAFGAFAADHGEQHNKDPWSSLIAPLVTADVDLTAPSAVEAPWAASIRPDWSSILAHNSHENLNVTSSDELRLPEGDDVDRALDHYGTLKTMRTDFAARSRPLRC